MEAYELAINLKGNSKEGSEYIMTVRDKIPGGKTTRISVSILNDPRSLGKTDSFGSHNGVGHKGYSLFK